MNHIHKTLWAIGIVPGLLFLLTLGHTSHAITPDEQAIIENAVPTTTQVPARKLRKLLIFSRTEGYVHESIPYGNMALKLTGEKSGAYEAVVSADMDMFSAENLNQFDAVLLNNTTQLKFNNPEHRESLLNFVKNGKGLIGIHSASDNFPTWPEGAEMLGGLFDGHPWTCNGTWRMKIEEPDHPLMKSLQKDFSLSDEIYRIKQPYSRKKVRVLLRLDLSDPVNLAVNGLKAENRDIPITWVKTYGQGRVFYCSLGHNNHIFWNTNVLQHYLDGVQFALGDLKVDTTPSEIRDKQEMEKILEQMSHYNFGQDRTGLSVISENVSRSCNNPELCQWLEAKMLAVLETDATFAGKQFICRQLRIIGSAQSVGPLATMLTNDEYSDMARYALMGIQDRSVNSLFRHALNQNVSDQIQLGLIHTLAARRDPLVIEQFSKLAAHDNPLIARAALTGLGDMGSVQTLDTLNTIDVNPQYHASWVNAKLQNANRLAEQGRIDKAETVYRSFINSSESNAVRGAAFIGLVNITGENGLDLVVDQITGDNDYLTAVALGAMTQVPGSKATEKFASLLSDLAPAKQVLLLDALACRNDTTARSAVIDTLAGDDQAVRLAALKVLGTLGDASTVKLLIATAAAAKGPERRTCRASLDQLKGEGIIEALLLNLSNSNAKTKVEKIRALEVHHNNSTITEVIKTTQDQELAVRRQSYETLSVIARQEDFPVLVDLMLALKDERLQKPAEKTVGNCYRRCSDQAFAKSILLDRIDQSPVQGKYKIMRILSHIGDDECLDTVKAYLHDENSALRLAAIRTLSNWPNATARDDLLHIAQNPDNPTEQVLALRGYIRLVRLTENQNEIQTLAMFQTAMDLSQKPQEKKMVLAGIADLKTIDALEMAADYIDEPSLRAEAVTAALKIAESTKANEPEKTKLIIEKVHASH